MCLHTNQRGDRSPCSKQEKLDPSILSRSVAVRGAIELQRGAPPPAKRRLDGGEA
jgi:hypothetical protein